MRTAKYTVSSAQIKELAARMREKLAATKVEQQNETTVSQEIQVEEKTPDPWPWPKSVDSSNSSEFSSVQDDNEGSENSNRTLSTLGTDRFGNQIEYNKEQLEAITLAAQKKNCIIIGAAGTGKTTVTKAVISKLIETGAAGVLNADGHKYLRSGTPGIVCISFTRRAVVNLRKNMSADMEGNCTTIHKLLEFAPVFYEIEDPKTRQIKKTMRFEPSRNRVRPLPSSIRTLIIDESSMVSSELYALLMDACAHPIQIILLGDIQQLPPVMSQGAILGFKMLEWPVVELTQVYRQALESPIIRLAHRILSGKVIPVTEYPEWHFPGQLKIHPWAKKIANEAACIVYSNALLKRMEAEQYDPEEDIVLCPYNVSFGTVEINKHIAQALAKKHNREVWEVIAGFTKHYFSVGDKVMYDREDAVITKIVRNANYTGARPQAESTTLSYWGADVSHSTAHNVDDTDFLLEQIAAKGGNGDVEERVNQASHRLTLYFTDSEQELEIDTAAEINSVDLGYALTVHKAQGSEWRRVYLALHQSHATMISRELLYTACTRAREELHIVCEPETFTKGIRSQRIKGNTLTEKAEFFKGKQEENGKRLVK